MFTTWRDANPSQRAALALRRFAVGATALAMGAGLAACGADDADGAEGSQGSASVEESKAAVAAAESANIAGFPMPEDPVEPGTRRLAVIGAGLSGGGVASYMPDIENAVDAIGWETDYFDGQYKPTVQSGLIQKAIAQEYDAVLLMVLDPLALASAFEALQESGIPSVCLACGPEVPEGITSVSYDMAGGGELQADWVIADSDGKAKILLIDSAEFAAVGVTMDAAAKRIEANCPDCEIVDRQPVLMSEVMAPNSTFFSSFLASHPKGSFDYVLSPFDAVSMLWAPQAVQRGRGEVKITGQGPQEQYLNMITDPDITSAAMTISAPQGFMSWASLDLLARATAGEKLWDASALPLGIVTPESADEFDSKRPYVAPDFDHEAAFTELWSK